MPVADLFLWVSQFDLVHKLAIGAPHIHDDDGASHQRAGPQREEHTVFVPAVVAKTRFSSGMTIQY